jgi:DNA invertase Pin-like site-specific DNA recombinase
MNCGIYVRVSTRDKGQDFTNQLIALREFAATQGWTICQEYVDQQSAKNGDREQFQRMFRDASQRNFDVLLFWSRWIACRAKGCWQPYSTCSG